MRVRLTRRHRALLDRRGSLRVRLSVSFTPIGGERRTVVRRVELLRPGLRRNAPRSAAVG